MHALKKLQRQPFDKVGKGANDLNSDQQININTVYESVPEQLIM